MNVLIKHIWHINIKKNRHHLCNTYVKIVNLHVSLKPCNKLKKKLHYTVSSYLFLLYDVLSGYK